MRHNFSEELFVKGNISFTVFFDQGVSKQDVIKSLHLISINPGVHVYFDEANFFAKDPFVNVEPIKFTRKKVTYPPAFQAVPKTEEPAEPEIQVEIPDEKKPVQDNKSVFKALEGLEEK
jgi:hypothetical protein